MIKRMSVLAVAAAAMAASPALHAEDFYKDKTLTYIVATNPGGGYDTYGRLIARYLEKHLPVDKVIVKNVPGAGHIIGANQVYAAKPDGLTIGTFNTGLIYAQILGRKGVKFDLRKMSWIGKAASDTRVIVLGKNSGFASFDDFAASASPVKMAVSGVGSAAYNDMRLISDALGLKTELVPGFKGNEGEMSILRGEVGGTIGSKSSLRPFVDNGHGFFALEIGGAGDGAIPQAQAYAKDDKAKSLVALIASQGALGRLTAGPPGIPEDRLATLRDAYAKALADPGLLAEAEKIDIPIEPAVGAQVADMVDEALNQSPDTVELIAAVMNMEVPTITVKTALIEVGAKGKEISFNSGDEQIEAKVSGSRTKVMIGGKEDDRKNLKMGMLCTIEYTPGEDNEPKLLDCGAATN